MKNFQMKIILSIFVVGIIIISLLGITISNMLLKPNPAQYIGTARIITVAMLLLFALFTIIIAIIEVKKYIEPMSRMLKGAKRAVFSADINNINIDAPEDELTESLNEIIKELKQNLKDSNSEKKQKETILKHMTDGVITFNMDGDITYINPAAKRMLDIKEKDNNFKAIFKKY